MFFFLMTADLEREKYVATSPSNCKQTNKRKKSKTYDLNFKKSLNLQKNLFIKMKKSELLNDCLLFN